MEALVLHNGSVVIPTKWIVVGLEAAINSRAEIECFDSSKEGPVLSDLGSEVPFLTTATELPPVRCPDDELVRRSQDASLHQDRKSVVQGKSVGRGMRRAVEKTRQ